MKRIVLLSSLLSLLSLLLFYHYTYLTQVNYVAFGFSYFVLLSLLGNFEQHCLLQIIWLLAATI